MINVMPKMQFTIWTVRNSVENVSFWTTRSHVVEEDSVIVADAVEVVLALTEAAEDEIASIVSTVVAHQKEKGNVNH